MIFRRWIKKTIDGDSNSKWASKASQLLMEFYHRCWEKRNTSEFGETMEDRVRIQKEQLLNKITFAYESRDTLFKPNDVWVNRIFQRKYEEWGSASITVMQKWIMTYEQTLKRRAITDSHLEESPEEVDGNYFFDGES